MTFHQHQPRTLTPREVAAMTAQCITVRYPDDVTPVKVKK
jgi:hypothetical protein